MGEHVRHLCLYSFSIAQTQAGSSFAIIKRLFDILVRRWGLQLIVEDFRIH